MGKIWKNPEKIASTDLGHCMEAQDLVLRELHEDAEKAIRHQCDIDEDAEDHEDFLVKASQEAWIDMDRYGTPPRLRSVQSGSRWSRGFMFMMIRTYSNSS